MSDSGRGVLKIQDIWICLFGQLDSAIIKRASEFNTAAHKSVALSLTQKRVAMLNKQYGNDDPGLTITDLYNEDGTGSGTRIEIRLPLQFSDH